MALRRKKKLILGVSAGALLGGIIILSVFATRRNEPEVTCLKLQVRPELRQTVTASGEVRPIRYIQLTSEIEGRIQEIYVNAGDRVTMGTPLVRIDPTQLQSNQDAQWAATQASINDVQNANNAVSSQRQALVVAEASVSAARQQLVVLHTHVDQAVVDLNNAQRELKRFTDSLESGDASRREYDSIRDKYEQAKVAFQTAKANFEVQKISVRETTERANQQLITVKEAQTSVKSAEMRANQQQAMLKGQQNQRSKATQLSPLNGIVADIPSRVGEYAVSTLSTTPLMTIADMSIINVEVNVDETEINNVAVEQQAKVKVDALGDQELKAVVVQRNPLAIGKSDPTGGLSTRINVQEAKEFKVTLELKDIPDDIKNALRPGMSSTATINTKTKNNVLAVPLESMVEIAVPAEARSATSTGADGAPSSTEKTKSEKGVYIIEGTRVRFVKVQTGITGESDIEITSGLNAGQEIVRGPSRVLKTLKDGMVVKRQIKKLDLNANEGS